MTTSRDHSQILAGLLSEDENEFDDALEAVEDTFGTFGHLPDDWATQIVSACVNSSLNRDRRYSLVVQLDRFSAKVVARAVEPYLYLDSAVIHDYSISGSRTMIDSELDDLFPGFNECQAVEGVIEAYLERKLRDARTADAYFLGASSDSEDWIEDPDDLPEKYDKDQTCGTCAHFTPIETTEGGVLGTCSIHRTTLGLFRQDSTCDDWQCRE